MRELDEQELAEVFGGATRLQLIDLLEKVLRQTQDLYADPGRTAD